MKPIVRVVSIAQLVLDEKNANKGTKRGRQLLGKSLEKYGAARSVVVDRNNRVIAGNKTVEAARAAGMKSISVIETDGSSLVAVQRGDLDLKRDKKARELAIADNRVGEIDLEWNPEVLASLDVDLAQFWNENELNALLKDFRGTQLSAPEPKLDQAAELQKKWKTKRNQIWEIGDHRLFVAERKYQPHHIANKLKLRVILDVRRSVGLAVAAHIRRHCVVTGSGQGGQNVPPAIPKFRPTVRQHDQRTLSLLGNMHLDAVHLDESVFDACDLR